MSRVCGFFATIREDFAVVFEKDPAIRSKIELFFNYPGLIAIVNHRFAHALHLRGWRVLARFIMGFNQFITNIDIHPGATIGRRVFIDHGIGVVIGETAEIGDDVTIYQGVSLGGVSLDRVKRHPTIESGVVIGAGAKILGNIIIGANSKIGANSVVVRDVPRDSTAVGIPARVIDKGRSKDSHEMNKLPDINKQLFEYLLKRVALLEHAIKNGGCPVELETRGEELERIYEAFVRSLKT
ncbi:MAG: serine O-acetyltransferase [Wolinella sp.]